MRLAAWQPSDDLLGAYRQVVGSTARLPLTFPALIASRLHRDLMGHGDLPVSGLGMVHVATQLWSAGRLPAEPAWEVSAWADEARHVRSGLEVDLWAACSAEDATWTARVVVLSRSNGAAGTDASTVPALPAAAADWPVRTPLTAPAGAGRAYARVSGDYNPIHLHRITAKPFGFRRAIAHGWWSLARSLALLGVDETSPAGHTYLDTVYRRPVLLPSRPTLRATTRANGQTRFLVIRDDGEPHLGGRLVRA